MNSARRIGVLALLVGSLLPCALVGSAAAAPGDGVVTQVADLSITPTSATSSTPFSLTDVNGTLFFTADNGITGREIWKSDGTTPSQVSEILPGTGTASPVSLTNVNGTLFFTADDGTGLELWKSVPPYAQASTTQVEDINTVTASTGSSPLELTNVNGTLFFSANDGINNRELWKSETPYTAATTDIVENINPAALPGGNSQVNSLTNVNGTLFFSADDGATGAELWKSVSPYTVGTTDIVQNVNTNPATGSDPTGLTNVGGTLIFAANDGSTGSELWRSNGATATQVANIRPAGASSFPAEITNINGTAFFSANDGSTGVELWRSDPGFTTATQVTDLTPGAQILPEQLTDVNGTLFFSGIDSAGGRELWRSQAPYTMATTNLVADIRPGPNNSSPNELTNFNGTLFFTALDDTLGRELWQSNGGPLGPGGTAMVADIRPGPFENSDPEELTAIDDTLFFRANDGSTGVELWKATIEGPGPSVTPVTPATPTTPSSPAPAQKKCKKKKKGKKGAGAAKKKGCKKKK